MVDRFRPIRFSRTGVQGLRVSATLSINDRVKEMWGNGENVFHLAFGESRFPVHQKIADALCRNVQKRSYLPALGIPELRSAIADHYAREFDLDVGPQHVLTGPGSKALIYATLQSLGDEVIIPRPSWVTYAPQAHLLRKPVTWVETSRESGYLTEPEVLRDALGKSRDSYGNPDVLILNNPGNPTGTMFSPDRIKELAAVCREEELMVISDEIYARTAFGEVPFLSFGGAYPEGTVVMGGLSKDLSLGGWRFGTAVVPPTAAGEKLAKSMASIATNVWSCVAAPIQYAALVAYSGDQEVGNYVRLCSQMHGIRTRYLYKIMADLGIPCPEPSGAFYIFPSFEPWGEALRARGIHDDRALAAHLLEEYEIATLPGSAFNASTDFCLRLSSSFIDLATDEQGDVLVAAFGEDPDPHRFIQNHHPELLKVAERFGEFVSELNS